MTTDYLPIACDIHDYLEIACLRNYHLRIELGDGSSLRGRALATETRADKSEWLQLDDRGRRFSVRLDQIMAFTPLESNAEFGRIALGKR